MDNRTQREIEEINTMWDTELIEELVETGEYTWSELDSWTSSDLRNELLRRRGLG